MVVFCAFGAFPSFSRVKPVYFTFVKNEALKAVAEGFKTVIPRRESAPGAREKETVGHATRIAGDRFLLSRSQGASSGRRGPVQGGRMDSCQLDESKVAAPLEAAWESIRSGLRRDLGARTFDGWLKPAALGGLDPDTGSLDIVMPSQFMADWVNSHFGERLTLAWRTTLPIVREVRVAAAADAPRPTPLLILEEVPAAPAERDPSTPNFDPRYRFETFI